MLYPLSYGKIPGGSRTRDTHKSLLSAPFSRLGFHTGPKGENPMSTPRHKNAVRAELLFDYLFARHTIHHYGYDLFTHCCLCLNILRGYMVSQMISRTTPKITRFGII